MRRFLHRLGTGLAAICFMNGAFAQQTTFTWQELRARFEAGNPTLRAGQLNIHESKAQEVTAYLRRIPISLASWVSSPFNGSPTGSP
jgi:hypothetical protein